MRYYILLVVALPLTLLLGCGKGVDGVPVSGRITRDNQPLAKAKVMFQSLGADGKPDANKSAGGETDDNGQYTLKRVQSQSAKVAPGEYRVEIHLIERGQRGIRELIPPQYSTKSTLKFTVPPEGTKDANFDVKSK